ncbi:MAG: type II toxin-antitoxin system PemK/MazF family toxin, partial [Bifidobacteriaceae bacterium]|nr:type II toxin-antitoxin system PemK/MazF family toxin [Bifidobacteriaceae bacterium]
LADKARPALVLTRALAQAQLNQVTLAPITSTIRGIRTEVRLGRRNGLDHDCVANCDVIVSVPKRALGDTIGFLLEDQEDALAAAISHAFDLRAT